MLTTFTVTSLSDATVNGSGNAPGTLRQAIYDANISSDADIIDFAAGLGAGAADFSAGNTVTVGAGVGVLAPVYASAAIWITSAGGIGPSAIRKR